MTFFKILAHIKEKPQMYFNEPLTLSHLDAFMLGFISGKDEKEIITPNGLTLNLFNDWLSGAIKPNLTEERGWRKKIEHISKDDSEAVKQFFDLIFKFSNGKIQSQINYTEPIILNWKTNKNSESFDEYKDIEEKIIKLEILEHEFSNTIFKIGYNENNSKVYVKTILNGKCLQELRYSEIEEKN